MSRHLCYTVAPIPFVEQGQGAWLSENRQLSIFGQPPKSRQHFDVWHQRSAPIWRFTWRLRAHVGRLGEPVAALINAFMYSPDVLKADSGKSYIIRTIAAVAHSLPPGRARHAR
jgi:hypothetical protein